MLKIDDDLCSADLGDRIDRMFALSAPKILAIEARLDSSDAAPVFTAGGRYTARGWTDWTQGFRYGSALLQFEATGDERFLAIGRDGTFARMPDHLTHHGVHDHGFQTISTWGNLWRLAPEGERHCYDLALRCSGAVQAARWTALPGGLGFVHSFNGPHSLFADTIRSLRVLALADRLGQTLLGEQDERIDLLDRLLAHAETTARFNVFFGTGRDHYDVRGRVAHESIFNPTNGDYRCPSSQQGWSPFSTWTRGQAWVLLGYAEQLEFLATVPDERFVARGGKAAVLARFAEVAAAVADHWIESEPTDGIPYWDTGAPGLALLGAWQDRPAEPCNPHEPVDSSAAAIAAQGMLRLGRARADARYTQAGLTIARRLLDDEYVPDDPGHEGLLIHGVYHRPNGWDHVPAGRSIPCGEAVMWGDYHLRELAILLLHDIRRDGWHTFF